LRFSDGHIGIEGGVMSAVRPSDSELAGNVRGAHDDLHNKIKPGNAIVARSNRRYQAGA